MRSERLICKNVLTHFVSGERTELETVTVSEKGQPAIPVDIRRKLDIKKGDKLLIVVHGKSHD